MSKLYRIENDENASQLSIVFLTKLVGKLAKEVTVQYDGFSKSQSRSVKEVHCFTQIDGK